MSRPQGQSQQIKGLIEPGNIKDLYNRPILYNPDGTWSTTSSMSFDEDGREVLIPTVVNGKRLTDEQAIQYYRRTGQHLGKFDSPENADTYATALHNSQASTGSKNVVTSQMMPAHRVSQNQDFSAKGGMTTDQLIDMLAQSGALAFSPLGMFGGEQSKKFTRDLGEGTNPRFQTTEVMNPDPVFPGPHMPSPTDDFMNMIGKSGTESIAAETVAPGEHVIDLAKIPAMSRRRFFKVGAGAAAAGYAAVKGAEAGAPAVEKAVQGAVEKVAPQAAEAVSGLGNSPLRMYERVGNKFVLVDEVHIPHTNDAHELGTLYDQALEQSSHISNRPPAAIRRIDPHSLHPELEMLGEEGGTRRDVYNHEAAPGSPDYYKSVHEADPYAKRLIESYKQFGTSRQRGTFWEGKEFTPENAIEYDRLYNQIFDDPRTLNDPSSSHQIHAYVVEKPIQVKYKIHPNNQGAIHDEVSRLAFRSGAGSEGIAESNTRMVASGDTYDEAVTKASQFLDDLGIDHSQIKAGSGKKIIRWTLPNGDIIEIRKAPSLEMGK